MRLDRYLANSGVGTRSEVKKIIHSKRVMVNGVIAKSDSLQVDENKDVILLDDEQIRYSKFYYIVLNKPEGYVSAVEDNLYPPVTDLISEYAFAKLFPVGRLDVDTTGTLLLTNDGELCHNMLSPKKHVDKTYSVEVDGEIKSELIDKFKAGIMLDDELTLPADLLILDVHHAELTIHQGKFHQVKRMFKYFNLNVMKLDRKSFVFLTSEGLEKGEYRLLTDEEIQKLNQYK